MKTKKPDEQTTVDESEANTLDETVDSSNAEIADSKLNKAVVDTVADGVVETVDKTDVELNLNPPPKEVTMATEITDLNMTSDESQNNGSIKATKIAATATTHPADGTNSSGGATVTVSKTTVEATPMAKQTTNTLNSSTENMSDWVVMPESAWPPPIFMKKSANPNERFYLQHRWHSQWAYYDSKATENKNRYYTLQRVVVIGSLIIPALVSLNSTVTRFISTLSGGVDETFIRIGVDMITVAISLAVAGAAALESLYKFGENWSSYRSAAEELQAEKNFYDMQSGPYANNPNPFATFVERVEGVVANQNGKYFQAVQKQIQKQEVDNEEIIASFKSGDDDDDEIELSVARQSATAEPADVG